MCWWRRDGIGQDRRRGVRRPPRRPARQQVLLHHADQGAFQPEVQRPGPPVRRRQGGPADRRQQRQRRGADRGHDHRGAAQHAVRGVAHAGRARVRRDGRSALPGRPVPRGRLGRGDHPPARVGPRGRPVRDGEQRRGVRRVARRGTRRHHRDRRRAPAGPAVAAHAGRQAAVRPVRLRGRRHPAGQPGADADHQGRGPAGADTRQAGLLEAGAGDHAQPGGRDREARREGLLPAITFIFSRAAATRR